MEDRFESDALLALGGQLSVEESQAMNMRDLQTSTRHASLMRKLQIFGDSILLSLCSRNPETVKSRVELAVKLYQEIVCSRDLMSLRLRTEVDKKLQLLAAKGLLW